MTFRSILVPLDGSSFAEEALPMARTLAERLGTELHLVHVLRRIPDYDLKAPTTDLEWEGEARGGAAGYLDEIAEQLEEGGGATVHTEVLQGPVVGAIKAYAEKEGVDLVVLTTHGEGGFVRWWLGSVADGLARESRVPLLLIRPWDETEDLAPGTDRFDHIAVPLDGSNLSEEALPWAVAIGTPFDARYSLIQAVASNVEVGRFFGAPAFAVGPAAQNRREKEATEYLETVASRFRERGFSVETGVIAASDPRDGILSWVRDAEADLTVMATHGRGGLSRMVLGSVADKVLRGGTTPLLLVRPGDPEEEPGGDEE